MDILLKPFLSKIKSYVKDDSDFLKKCKRNLIKNSKLVSFDVTSLYTNIAHELGLKAIEYWFPVLIHSRFNKSFIIEALKLVLKNNHFVFNKEFFHQIAGTAMGTVVAPTYATLVMQYLEIQFCKKCKNEFGVNNGKYIEENWHRFLDDCNIALDATNINPLKNFYILNNIHYNIKFTMEQHNLYLPFLDMMINKDPETNNIWMDIFHKKTDTQRCVPFNSCRPKQCKNNIPFTLARRIYTIVENSEVRKKHLHKLQKVLYYPEYSQNLIQEAIRKVTSIPIEGLRTSQAKTYSNNLAFVTTFSPNNKNVFPLIQTTFKSLKQSYETKECFKDIKLIKSQSQPSSLKNL